VTNSSGLAPVVGIGESFYNTPLFAGVGGAIDDSVMTQLANGSLDDIGISGNFFSSSLAFTASLMLPGSAGMAPVQAVNQEEGTNFSVPGDQVGSNHLEGVQFIQQLSNGTFNNVYADSGYGDPTREGMIYASNQLNLAMPGWHVVDAGGIASEIFPIS
jgi:hypothetical protein